MTIGLNTKKQVIDRGLFFGKYPYKMLSAEEILNLHNFFDRFEKEQRATNLRMAAYMLATWYHEMKFKFISLPEGYYIQPEEKRVRVLRNFYAKHPSRETILYPDGRMFTGEGPIMITHDYNYEWADDVSFSNGRLKRNPILAREINMGLLIMFKWFFYKHWRAFSNNVWNGGWNLEELRGIINGKDKWRAIGVYASDFYNVLNWTEAENETVTVPVMDRMYAELYNLKVKLLGPKFFF